MVDVEAARSFGDAVRQVASSFGLPTEVDALDEIESSEDASVVKRASGRPYPFLNDAGTGAAGGVFVAYLAAQFGITPTG